MQNTVVTIGRRKVSISEINAAALSDQPAFFKLCNDKYEEKVNLIAKHIAADPNSCRLIMLSGPSASGKTTTSLKIQHRLKSLGCEAVTISMDDFFKNRDDAPLLADGSKDYESVEAVDTDLLKDCLTKLTEEGSAMFPVFDFKSGIRHDNDHRVNLDKCHVAIVEGLHALDPKITDLLPSEFIYKIYVSVSSDYIGDEGEVVLSARDMRLIRRSVRDYNFRGSDVEQTLGMWDAVCEGEDLYVRPYKKFADITVNSAFSCGPCLFKEIATKLFKEVPADSRFSKKANHILKGLERFEPMDSSLMPSSCVLLEFFGGSEYY